MKRFRIFSYAIRSLDFKVPALVGLVILAMAVGSLLLFKRLADQAQSLLFDAMDAMSFAVHHGLLAQIHERYFDLHAFARNPAVQAMEPEAITRILNVFVGLYGIYDVIVVTDRDGRFVSSNSLRSDGTPLNIAALRSYDYSQETWFQAVHQGGTYISEPAPDPYLKMMDGRDERTNTFATAVIDESGRILGVICIRAGVRWIQKELDQAFAMFHAGGFNTVRMELINANGERVVAAGAPLPIGNASEYPVHYPGTADRSRVAKIWSIAESDAGEFMVGSSFFPAPAFASSLGWSLRVMAASSSASRQLAETVRMSYAWILMASVGLLVLSVAYLRRLVISRYLQQQVEMRTAELHQSTHDLEERNRELEQNRQELMTTNQQLLEAQKELLDTAKRLGQAEVAALTLHNIGNIITSLNIQSTLLREHFEKDAPGQLTLAYLKKVETLGRYPDGLKAIIERLENAEKNTLMEMQNLMRGLIDNVRMAMSAISSQLAFVHQNESAQSYKLSELLQHTLVLYVGTFTRHQVKQLMELEYDAVFLTERFRFESILTVLIRNAIDATGGQTERRIGFASKLDDKTLTLMIHDNGHGFDEDVASRIFRFGFSTKARGHGFGLHYAANSCRHLGLELKLGSPGMGLGATASICIPRDRLLTVIELVDFPQSRKEEHPDQYDKAGPDSAHDHGGNRTEPGRS